jgi:hypothetical protein
MPAVCGGGIPAASVTPQIVTGCAMLYGAGRKDEGDERMKTRITAMLLVCLGVLPWATAYAEDCEALKQPITLFEADAEALAMANAPAGCSKAWDGLMRGHRHIYFRDVGERMREETWSYVVEETGENCMVDGAAVVAGQLDNVIVTCERRFRCQDDEPVPVADTACDIMMRR